MNSTQPRWNIPTYPVPGANPQAGYVWPQWSHLQPQTLQSGRYYNPQWPVGPGMSGMQYLNSQPQMHRAITRPPFRHGKHLKWVFLTGGAWLLGYSVCYLVHRFGPTKAVTTFQYR